MKTEPFTGHPEYPTILHFEARQQPPHPKPVKVPPHFSPAKAATIVRPANERARGGVLEGVLCGSAGGGAGGGGVHNWNLLNQRATSGLIDLCRAR